MIWAVIWYWLLAVFTAADVITTEYAITKGLHEANPFMAGLIDNIFEVKMGFLLLMIIVVVYVERHKEGHGWIPLAGCACVTFIAVVSNIIQIARF